MRKHRIWFRLGASVVIAGVIAGLAAAGLANNVFFGTQLRLSDALFPSGTADRGVVVVAIDQASLNAVGQRWPWDRSVHARLIDQLHKDGAAWIGYDVTFSVPSTPKADDALAKSIAKAGNVILGESVEFPQTTPGDVLQSSREDGVVPAFAKGAAGFGHVNVFPDTDGVTRSLPPAIHTSTGALMPSLSMALYEKEIHATGPITVQPNGFEVGNKLVETGPAHLMDINYVNFPNAQIVPAYKVLDGTVDPGKLSGRIVLVGATAQGLQDYKLTPLDKSSGQPGVLVHATALNTMLSGAYIHDEGHATTVFVTGLMALAVALAVMFLWLWLSPFITIGLIAAFVAVVFRRFNDDYHVMNIVYPLIGAIVAYIASLAVKYFTEVRERRRVTHVFGRYVAPDVVQEVLSSPEAAMATLTGESRPLSILFADLRGFTAASEDAAPEEVVQALNVYLDAMTRAVLEERGTIDKFMGDCVMAFWGAPKDEPQHAMKAVRAAMRMQDHIDEAMGGDTAAHRLKVKGCGVGVATGPAVVGNIGSAERLDYTVIGDTVNTASRLCGVAGPGEIVCTSDTAYQVGLLDEHLRLSELPPLVVKGKAEPLKVFQVLREGQEAVEVREGEVTVAVEEKGHFEPEPAAPNGETQESPVKVAGYAPVEPLPEVRSGGGPTSE